MVSDMPATSNSLCGSGEGLREVRAAAANNARAVNTGVACSCEALYADMASRRRSPRQRHCPASGRQRRVATASEKRTRGGNEPCRTPLDNTSRSCVCVTPLVVSCRWCASVSVRVAAVSCVGCPNGQRWLVRVVERASRVSVTQCERGRR